MKYGQNIRNLVLVTSFPGHFCTANIFYDTPNVIISTAPIRSLNRETEYLKEISRHRISVLHNGLARSAIQTSNYSICEYQLNEHSMQGKTIRLYSSFNLTLIISQFLCSMTAQSNAIYKINPQSIHTCQPIQPSDSLLVLRGATPPSCLRCSHDLELVAASTLSPGAMTQRCSPLSMEVQPMPLHRP